MGFSLGISWGAGIEFDVKELTDTKVVLEGKGISKDVKSLEYIAKKAYNVSTEVLSTEPTTEEDFKIDNFIRDKEKWKVKMTIEEKGNV